MNLNEFMKQNRQTLAELALQTGLSPEVIRRARHGVANVSMKSLQKIEASTGAAVTVTEMVAVRQEYLAKTSTLTA